MSAVTHATGKFVFLTHRIPGFSGPPPPFTGYDRYYRYDQLVDLYRIGYAITDPKKYLDFELKKYELEPLKDDRITVAVEVCGVCGSVRPSLHLSRFLP